MKPTKPGPRRQKIILYYTLAVVMPGIILGYMAFRGISNDKALREKESRSKLEINSQAFFSAIDSSLVQFINDQISDSILSGIGKDDPSLLALFVRDSIGSTKLIAHQLLYLPSELLTVKPEYLSRPSGLNEGQRLEFIERRYSEALRFYQDKILKTKSTQEKVQSLVASARLYNKMNQPEQAETVYNEIMTDYEESLLNGQIPVALLASLEILKINRLMGENEKLRNNSRQYLELLLNPPCEYGMDQFGMFYQFLQEILKGIDLVTDSLRRELDNQRKRTDYLLRVITEQDINQVRERGHFIDSKNRITCNPINYADISAVSLTWQNNNKIQTGMVIDFPVYLKSVSEALIEKLDPSSSIDFMIQDNNGKTLISKFISQGSGYLYFPFPEHLPEWELGLSENRLGFIPALFKTGSGIYLFIFILIALFMILGFAFTMYTLNVELRLNKLKSEFISNVSHELKSPLTAIRMMTEMLHYNRVQTEERKSAYYSAMLEESEHLSHLIDNILDFSRMEDDRKKYDFTDLDLDELLRKFLESTRESIPHPDFDIRYNYPEKIPVIKADKNAIIQVFYNLVDNAIKFSGTAKLIDVTLSSQDNEVIFCVKDYGIGIPAKDREKIFDRFYRGDEPQRLGIKGSGIGLTIVQKIVEAHNGHMTMESKSGEGSTFCIHLPVNNNA